MTSYPQVLVNVKVADRHPNVAVELADEIAAARANRWTARAGSSCGPAAPSRWSG